VANPVRTRELGRANLVLPAVAPVLGVANRTPLTTPIGVSPHYKTPTEIWDYDYGNGGDGQGNGGNWT